MTKTKPSNPEKKAPLLAVLHMEESVKDAMQAKYTREDIHELVDVIIDYWLHK